MPANAKIRGQSALSSVKVKFAANFSGSAGSGKWWSVTKVVLVTGPDSGTTLITIPTFEDSSNKLSVITSGALASIRHGQRCKVRDDEGTTVYVGSVSNINRNLQDVATIELQDDRRLLAGVYIIGRLQANEDVGGGFGYRSGWAAIFNKDGKPNRLDVNGVSVFCRPNWNLKPGEAVPDPNSISEKKATFWTPKHIMAYLQYVTSSSFSQYADAVKGYTLLPDEIIWPDGLASALDSWAGANEVPGQRVGVPINCEKKNLLDIIDEVLSSAGPFTLGMDVAGDSSKMVVCYDHFSVGGGSDGISIKYAAGSQVLAEEALSQYQTVTDGNISSDSKNLYTKYLVNGQLVYIERRIISAKTIEEADGEQAQLMPAWDMEKDAESIIKLYNSLVDKQKSINWADIWLAYPNAFCAYKLVPIWDFTKETNEQGKDGPALTRMSRPILSHLLTSVFDPDLTGNKNEEESDQVEKAPFRMPIAVEYEVVQGETSVWAPCLPNDGLRVDEWGTLFFPGLRDGAPGLNGSQTYEIVIDQNSGHLISIKPRRLRMTVAIPCDHRVSVAGKLAGSPGNAPVISADDQSEIDSEFERLLYIDSELYNKEVRGPKSFPVPESAYINKNGEAALATAVPDKKGDGSDALRDDSEYMRSHLVRKAGDFGRLDRVGVLYIPHALSVWRPGMAVRELTTPTGDSVPVKLRIHKVEIGAGPDIQYTKLYGMTKGQQNG